MGSRNSQNAINNSNVTPCRALQKLNHLVIQPRAYSNSNQANPSKVQQFICKP